MALYQHVVTMVTLTVIFIFLGAGECECVVYVQVLSPRHVTTLVTRRLQK